MAEKLVDLDKEARRAIKEEAAARKAKKTAYASKDAVHLHGKLQVRHVHDRKHPAVRLSVRNQDSVVWFSRRGKFRILSIHKDELADKRHRASRAPDNPFYREFPIGPFFKGWKVNSGPPRPEAAGQQYKVTFELNGKVIDPHIFIGKDGDGDGH